MNDSNLKKRECWIDLAKCFAIIAVLVDHSYGFLYTDYKIALISFYSVSLFIFLFGVTSYLSFSDYFGPIVPKVLNSLWKIIRPYIVATFILCIYYKREFVWTDFLHKIIHFDVELPFYFVFLYIQLTVLVPLLFFYFSAIDAFKFSKLYEMIGFILVCCFGSYTTNHSDICGIYGGGGKLFGGTYLILLYAGMWFGKHKRNISHQLKLVIPIFLILLIVTAGWVIGVSNYPFKLDESFPFGYGLNPPGVSLMIYAILLALLLFFLECLIERYKHLKAIYSKCSIFGKHTLYIFLYHKMFLSGFMIKAFQKFGIIIDNEICVKIIVVLSMLAGPIIIEFFLERFHEALCKAYGEKTHSF